MTDHEYYVVEFRFPIQVTEAPSVEQAASLAASEIEKMYGFRPSLWYTRVFKYQTGIENIGPVEEWFCNPQGTEFRLLDANHAKHEEAVKNVKPL